MTLIPFPAPKEAKVFDTSIMIIQILRGYPSFLPTLRAMIFRWPCAPKKNNDAMHRLIFFGAVVQHELSEWCHHQRMVLLGSVHMVFRVLIK